MDPTHDHPPGGPGGRRAGSDRRRPVGRPGPATSSVPTGRRSVPRRDGGDYRRPVTDWAAVLLDPTGAADRGQDRTLAPRPPSLRGATLALLDNTKPNAGALLEEVGRQLAQRFGLREVKVFSKDYFGTPVDRTQVERIVATCGFAVTAIGD